MHHLNIGILAHIDAGKTSLTEQLLHHAGVIDHVGRVDTGDTQTDSMDLERRRGITIRSAVVSFVVGDTRINLIDTPGHPDFISEVERALRVLDGVVLVVSAVEGVQAQTRVLMRALTRLRLPVVIFANKIDRTGARDTGLLTELTDRLGVACVPMSSVDAIGTAAARTRPATSWPAEILAEHSDTFLSAYLSDRPVPAEDYRAELVRQTRLGLVAPVYFGSARTGEGVAELATGLPELLATTPDPRPELRASVFKIERGRAREKIAYVRVFSGSLGARDHVQVHGEVTSEAKVTAVRVFEHGVDTVEARAETGQIAKVSGLKDIRIGDHIGVAGRADAAHFPPPGLETAVHPASPGLFAALQELAEQDPLITVRQDDHTITVRLYGEVQKEVIRDLLAEQHGLTIEFADTRTICVERPTGTGTSVWEIGDGRNPHYATLGLRVAPGTGLTFALEVELGSLPLAFHKAIEETTHAALTRGPLGWEVVDVAVTVTHTGYLSPVSTAGDFRKVTPLALHEALRRAGTEVLEPISRFELELPADTVPATLSRLVELGAVVTESAIRGERAELGGTVPTGQVHRFGLQLPGLSRGEGLLTTEVSGYRPVQSAPGA
ncbi:TetM/TetW/TetO/TetS family tetracycline resistance ribosomal protection protein [Lentzea tibetensis]|uniref:TetM/TetW/TetO/TetS family tetracycline resistance ribosomal protection protein n=1 Tax=Lentzea tibetensis TaxID=2591470 RepID=A0A563F2L1_9PSEU|nr:TetM/TetW/TetO/TetS family tetracycline resistance ribosomal protection protein [Lentzea tibetensis]TWP54052.1 TetM/TetW/TetO/TetS family tetracycline resistance ribosomal protection protein [Lentzea tibetensis]